MTNDLFKDFNSVSSKQWKQKIQYDLNGADYNEALIWKSNEDIAVKPFYHSDDFIEYPKSINNETSPWKICQSIFVANVEKSNQKAVKAIDRGAESILFFIPSETVSVDNLLKNIDVTSTQIIFELQFLSENFIKQLTNRPDYAQIYIQTDIIGHLAKNGNWYYDIKEDFNKFDTIIKNTSCFNVDTCLYQNAGANMVQQLAYGLAHANEYLNHLDSRIDNPTKQTLKVNFNIAIGNNFFFEIAKLRAFRLLWKTLASEYQIFSDCHIVATPSKRNKTIYDYNTNMLRTTTECMSAILGGANSICNLPYDSIYHKDNAFGERISRNQLLILKHESYFDKVSNPADGSYYIEDLTSQLAEKALALFKSIEATGGFLKQLKAGTIQRKIKESAGKEQKQFDAGEDVLIGTNKYQNPHDKMKDDLELYPFVKTHQRKTLIEPIIEKRLAENIEQLRLKNDH